MQRKEQKLNENEELKIQYTTAINSLALIRQEISKIEPLVKSGLAPETRLLALQREEETSQGKAASAESAQLRINSSLREIENNELKKSYPLVLLPSFLRLR